MPPATPTAEQLEKEWVITQAAGPKATVRCAQLRGHIKSDASTAAVGLALVGESFRLIIGYAYDLLSEQSIKRRAVLS
jgi:hypothetical protein